MSIYKLADESPRQWRQPVAQGLYDPRFEKDSCGVGFVCNLGGQKTHTIIKQGIEVLANLQHRGASGADVDTGDGAGILIQIPDRFFREVCHLGFDLPQRYGVGMMFLPTSKEARTRVLEVVERTLAEEGLRLLGWRETPTDSSPLGEAARRSQPAIWQCFADAGTFSEETFERKLYIARRQCEKRVAELLGEQERFYVPSFSCRTIVFKGLMLARQLPAFYADLGNPCLQSALALVHQRYSTNTFPSWELAQPFRYLAHNGEINTLRGNLNWMRARERNLNSDLFGSDIEKILPVIDEHGSDSACLDNTLELLVHGGRSLPHAMLMLIPQAWGPRYPMGPDLRGFFEYHAGLMEPWDGPAAIAFTDGRCVGALLDRNGLRPARYTITKEGFMVLASEAGVLDIAPEAVREKDGLRPGRIVLANLETGRVHKDVEIKMSLARRRPYRRWVEENKITVHGFFDSVCPVAPEPETLLRRQKLFGYTREDLTFILDPMAATGNEPVGSMGADEPLAVLSEHPQLLYWYFKQMFAQVTNPAIDPIREELVMSLMTFIGTPDNILCETPQHARLVKLRHPVLSNEDLARLRNLRIADFTSVTLQMGFLAGGGGEALETALDELCQHAEAGARAGHRILVLSDRDLPEGRAPIPALLAVSAVNQHLIRHLLRTGVGLILETGEAREVMHLAILLGYGASAVNPYLAFETIADLALSGRLSKDISLTKSLENYIKALCKGLLKIMSKMGISTLRSYRSAQVFEAIGLNSNLIERYFPGTPSRIEGIGLEEIAREASARYAAAHASQTLAARVLPSGGHYTWRADGERHLWSPDAIFFLQQATRKNDYELYRKFAALVNEQSERQFTLRGLFRFRKPLPPVPLGEVEPESELVKRFVTGAMSFGSISQEAHETLAIAMNQIGAMSNSGEGGEDPERYVPLPNGGSRSSAIKQVASGRFGVTAEYLVNARDLQIKIAQGAKPGEGGQLPGDKVYPWIAKTRHSIPYVTLISPPPHHDIYSIEDLKQLIYDLKCSNPDARVSVKLVAEAGVGTVAAGVAKAHADVILISGYDGGTGASPLSSLHHAGVPWELGLAETQQTLVLNRLRSRVRLQTDGQLKTGRDVVVAAMLGAEEFGFATAALVVLGCVLMRACHKNTCPVGVATQDPDLRKFYTGCAEYVVNFMHMIAREVREILAELGCRRLEEIVGRADLLEVNDAIRFWKARGLDFSKVFYRLDAPPESMRQTQAQYHELETALDHRIWPQVEHTVRTGTPVELGFQIRNVHRTVGTIISSRIARRYGGQGLPDDTITLRFRGSAGQSFAAFCSRGMTLILEGEANDYLGKGLSGAKIIVRPPPSAEFDPAENIIVGNVVLYGATAGEAYICGQAGERFAIRNSGALAVVEGVGDHGCEYMTGGRVAILGPTGVNFGAGMSGGIAYVYDPIGLFDERCNLDMIDLERVEDARDEQELRAMIENHVRYTSSRRGQHILKHWERCLPYFVKVFPIDYKRALGRLSREDQTVERAEVVRD